MKKDTVEVSFNLISIAGDAKSSALMALQYAKDGNFEEAHTNIKYARKKLTEVHNIHADILSAEASGEKIDITTLFVHSQDHLTSAIIIIDLAQYIIDLYELKNNKKFTTVRKKVNHSSFINTMTFLIKRKKYNI